MAKEIFAATFVLVECSAPTNLTHKLPFICFRWMRCAIWMLARISETGHWKHQHQGEEQDDHMLVIASSLSSSSSPSAASNNKRRKSDQETVATAVVGYFVMWIVGPAKQAIYATTTATTLLHKKRRTADHEDLAAVAAAEASWSFRPGRYGDAEKAAATSLAGLKGNATDRNVYTAAAAAKLVLPLKDRDAVMEDDVPTSLRPPTCAAPPPLVDHTMTSDTIPIEAWDTMDMALSERDWCWNAAPATATSSSTGTTSPAPIGLITTVEHDKANYRRAGCAGRDGTM
jgi:hypothetical protein